MAGRLSKWSMHLIIGISGHKKWTLFTSRLAGSIQYKMHFSAVVYCWQDRSLNVDIRDKEDPQNELARVLWNTSMTSTKMGVSWNFIGSLRSTTRR